jgi:hypothetical protein
MAQHLKQRLRSAGLAWATALVVLGAAAAPAAGPPAAQARPLQEHAAGWAYQPPAVLSDLAQQGERLYLDGVRADGSPLSGQRHLGGGDPVIVQGVQAACVQCHRRSGLGAVEGDMLVPPISGRALFHPGGVAAVMDTRARRLLNTAHEPYDDESLAVALRGGHGVGGRPLHGMMPRFNLSDGEVAALKAYLQTLSPTWSPGVSTQRVRLASVIAPDVQGERRAVAIDMLRALVSRKNLGTRPGRRHMVSALEFVLRTERQWEHEIWELSGPPETWGAQLRERQARNPVFGIASGVAGDWTPVHAFCQAERVPCWLPAIDAVQPTTDSDFYGLYFSAGVGLEAQVLANQLPAGSRLLQLVSNDAAARLGANTLAQLRPGIQQLVVGDSSPQTLAAAVHGLRAEDNLVLWLRPSDLPILQALTPPAAGLWTGTQLSGEEAAWPAAWRAASRVVTPYELPSLRQGNLAGLRAWLGLVRKPLVDEAMQSQIYFAMNFLNETLGEMLQNLHRDYLLERAESMLGRREQQVAAANMVAQRSLRRVALNLRDAAANPPAATPGNAASNTPANTPAGVPAGAADTTAARTAAADGQPQIPRVSTAELTAHRDGNSIFPRLSLAPGQRYAAKGAWVLRPAADGQALTEANAVWVTP